MIDDNERNAEELMRQLPEDSDDVPKKKAHTFFNSLLILLVLGVLGRIFFDLMGWSPKLKIKIFSENTETAKINLISYSDTNLVIRTDKGEIKLLNPTTQKVQDISLGDNQASHAALSPDGQFVAYVSTNNEGSALNLVSQEGNVTSLFDAKTFNTEAKFVFSNDSNTKLCEWSKLYWSPEKTDNTSTEKLISQAVPVQEKPKKSKTAISTAIPQIENRNVANNVTQKKLAFFACNSDESILFLVSTTENTSKIKPLLRTKAKSNEMRQAVWLADGKIVFTTGDTIQSLFLLNPNSDEILTHLYGNVEQ